tara:strand:+ start:429 stop:680 length:252 start_codon:yes stop_codon:yes gene_type:complete
MLLGACVGSLALGYVLGAYHVSSIMEKDLFKTFLKNCERDPQALTFPQKIFDKALKRPPLSEEKKEHPRVDQKKEGMSHPFHR